MKRIYFLLPLLGILFFIVSCNNNNSHDNKTILTERIQYPVFIKCPYEEETDWWKENLEGPKREKFVNLLLDAVAEGKVKAYDYIDNSELSKKHIGHIFSRSDTLLMPSSVPPYDEKDTIINVKLERKDIHRLTFLEEWYFDEKNFLMEKKVVGIAPAVAQYSEDGELKGYKPLFWIYLDKKYPLKK